MINVKFISDPLSNIPNKPTFIFLDDVVEKKFWMLGELYACDVEYIIEKVIPNLDKIMKGELVQDPTRQDEYLVDYYEFGYDATIIDFYKDKCIINYDFWQSKFEAPSEFIYEFMKEWAKHLEYWKKNINN